MDNSREPHSVSLKVLRLTRPLLSQKFPFSKDSSIQDALVSGTESQSLDSDFILSPALALPPAFGAAYVGETFTCALCANNELAPDANKLVSNPKLGAEMQGPSGGKYVLELLPAESFDESVLGVGQSIQRITSFDLREEGDHILALSISYTETIQAEDNSASSGRLRLFKKLYRFPAKPCLNVRTKISPLVAEDGQEFRSLALEAQLDNVTKGPVTLKDVTFTPKPAFRTTSLNWNTRQEVQLPCPVLFPADVTQFAFLIEQREDGPNRELTRDGRLLLGQLSIQWRTAMGDTGFLSTGWLSTKRR